MSRARLAAGGVLMAGVLAGSGVVGLAAWPLAIVRAPTTGQVPGGPGQLAVVHREPVDVPAGLTQQLTHATILLDLVVDAAGMVTSARPVSFAIRNETSRAGMSFTDLRSFEGLLGKLSAAPGQPAGRAPFTDGAAIVRDLDTMLTAASAALTQWRFEAPAAAPAIARIPVEFDLVANAATAAAAQPLSGFAGAPGELGTFVARRDTPANDGTLRVGGNIRPPQKIHSVNPVYPQEAKDAQVQGVVIIEAKIAPDGSVAEAWVLRSIPMLDGAALEAVRQWRFMPTLLNGAPVPVIVTVTVNFTLAD